MSALEFGLQSPTFYLCCTLHTGLVQGFMYHTSLRLPVPDEQAVRRRAFGIGLCRQSSLIIVTVFTALRFDPTAECTREKTERVTLEQE